MSIAACLMAGFFITMSTLAVQADSIDLRNNETYTLTASALQGATTAGADGLQASAGSGTGISASWLSGLTLRDQASVDVVYGSGWVIENDQFHFNPTGGPNLSGYQGLLAAIQAGFGPGQDWQGTYGVRSYEGHHGSFDYAVGLANKSDLGLQSWGGVDLSQFTNPLMFCGTILGDANLDGVVDQADYDRWQKGEQQNLAGWVNGDFNYDGFVDDYDLQLLQYENPNLPNPPPVPEPSTFALLGIGLIASLGYARLRRRRGGLAAD
jgi:hypothetical protein